MGISTRYDVTDVVICTDCAMMVANGETGTGDESADVAHSDAMVAHMGADVMRLALDCRHDDEDDSRSMWHDDFSTAQCDACGTWLAGDRCHAVIMTGRES